MLNEILLTKSVIVWEVVEIYQYEKNKMQWISKIMIKCECSIYLNKALTNSIKLKLVCTCAVRRVIRLLLL